MNLRPVTYNFNKDKMDELIGTVDSSDYPEKYDIEKIKQSGFLAALVVLSRGLYPSLSMARSNIFGVSHVCSFAPPNSFCVLHSCQHSPVE